MTTLDWAERKTVSPSFRDIKQRGLTGNLEELEAYGLTVITPDQLGEPPVLKRARDAILALAEERTGVRHDIETGAHGTLDSTGSNPNQYLLYAFLERDPVFEEIVRHPATLPLVEYYLGADCQLSSLTSFIKWQNESGDGPKGLHSDSALYRNGPLPDRPHVFNTNWILTDYTKDNGALAIVPGSHRLQRHPEPGEGVDEVVPVEAPAGSVLVFHGNVWHSAFPRRNPGLRVSINAYYCGPHYRAQESFRGRISDEILARNDDRFAQLLGYDDPWGFTDSRGPVPYSLR
jgi:ectoine hydroxylase-related dioxygenase (phytanoyl-CoA dioxygenase family)